MQEIYERRSARYAWLVMGLCAVVVLSLFMVYCRVSIHTLSFLSRLEKYAEGECEGEGEEVEVEVSGRRKMDSI
jgi:hypothetical protein